jgi:hypothetical protein
MRQYERQYEETRDGFTIMFSTTYEDAHPRDMFDDSCYDIDKMCRDIDEYRLQWFIARVDAYKCGVLLASEYIGGNLYANVLDFLKDGYYKDMVLEAIDQANKKITELTKENAYV